MAAEIDSEKIDDYTAHWGEYFPDQGEVWYCESCGVPLTDDIAEDEHCYILEGDQEIRL